MNIKLSTVPAKGIGRKDYTTSTEKFVEPVISSWQSVYLDRRVITVPAAGNVVTNIAVPLNQVIFVYDFFASIPANSLIRLVVEAVDQVGTTLVVVDETAYQTVVTHISKGYPFFVTIRFTTYNYGLVDQDFRIGCSGLYTSSEEYALKIGFVPPLLP